jgi:hypothetical protein
VVINMKKILFLLALLFPLAAHAQTAAYNGWCDQGTVSAVTSGLSSTNKLDGVIPYCTVTVYLDGVSQVSSAAYISGGTITGTIGQTCNATFTGGTPSGMGVIALTGTNVIASGGGFAIAPPGTGHYTTAPTTATLSNGTATCSGTATVVTVLSPIKATIYKDSVNTPQTNSYQTLANGQILFYAATGQAYDIVKSGGIAPLVYTTPVTVTGWIVPGGGGGTPGGTNGQVQYNNAGAFGGYAAIPVAFGGTGATTAYGAATNLGVPQWLTGTGAPSATCSAIANNGTFYTNTTSQIWQCSNVTGSYTWSQLGPSLNCAAASVYFNILCYGGVGDELPAAHVYQGFSGTSGSNILTATGAGFTSAVVGKWVALNNNGVAWSPGPPFSGSGMTNIAQITGFTDSNHVTLSRNFANSVTGYVSWGTDNTPAANACRAAAAAAGGGDCQLLAGNYLFATIGKDSFGNAYYTKDGMAQDTGDYSQPAGGSGATLNCPVVSGTVPSCTVSGGTGYTANSKLPIVFSDTAEFGCSSIQFCGGLYGYVNTNGSGVPTTVTLVYNGFGYTASSISGTVLPLGGDGATASCTLSGGTCGVPSISAGGTGYAASMSSTGEIFAMQTATSGCTLTGGTTAYPIVGKGTYSTSSGGVVNSAAWTTAPSSCTNAPAIIFNDVACWNAGTSNFTAQCTNLAPLLPSAIPIRVAMDGASFGSPTAASQSGVGTDDGWDGYTVDTVTPGALQTQPILWYGHIQNMDVGGLNPNAWIGVYDPFNVNTAKIHDMITYGGIGILTGQYDLGSSIDNIQSNSFAGIVNGGQWSHRADYALGEGGIFDLLEVSNIVARTITGYGTVAANIDTWFANEFWRPEFTADSPDFAETCAFPQSPNQRMTSPSLSANVQVANTLCYKGITGFGMLNLARDSRAAGSHPITSIAGKYLWRPIYYGSLGASTMSYLSCENCTQLVSDPYRNETTQEGAVEINGAGWANINNLSWNGSATLYPIYDFDGNTTFGEQGQPLGVGWNNINTVNLALALTSVANSSGSTAVYTGTITGGASNALAGLFFGVGGFSHAVNNGTFVATASTGATITLRNANAIAETASAQMSTSQAPQNINVAAPIQNGEGMNMIPNVTSPTPNPPISIYDMVGSSPELEGTLRGAGFNQHYYCNYDAAITPNCLVAFSTDAVSVEVPFYAPNIESSGGQNCLQINAVGLITNTGSACGSGSSGVTSWSGDGALYNNAASTGVVTATLANAGAHKWWGNNTGSTAAPGYQAIGTGDLPAIPLSGLATQTANTVVGNGTSGSASPTALTMPSCSGASNALTWTTSGGSTAFGCNTISNATTISTTGGVVTNSTFYPLFVASNSSSNQAVNTGTNFQYQALAAKITLGVPFTTGGQLSLADAGSANTVNINVATQSGNFSVSIPGVTAADTFTTRGLAQTFSALNTFSAGVSVSKVLNTAAQTTVSCSTSGSAIFSQPQQGSSDKKVLIHLAACLGTASYTYPTAFTNSPSCYASSLVACTVAGTISASAVTVTGATSTGSLVLEDY